MPGRSHLRSALITLALGMALHASLATAAPALSDLQVASLAVSPSTVTPGSTVNVSTELGNTGPSSARSVVVEFWLAATTRESVLLARVNVGTLSSGATTQVRQTLSIPMTRSPGTDYIHVLASTSSAEASLTNNVWYEPVTVAEAPAPVPSPVVSGLKYRAFFDATRAANAATLNSRAAAGGKNMNYYYFQHILMGFISMFEATGDVKYLEQVLTWVETMISRATIIDFAGYKNWEGEWTGSPWVPAGVGIHNELSDIHTAKEFSRVVRIVKTSAALESVYGARAKAILSFVHQHIVKKIFVHRRQEVNWENYFHADPSRGLGDKTIMSAQIFVDMHRSGLGEFRAGRTYLDIATDWMVSIKDRFSSPAYNGIQAAGAGLLDFNNGSEPVDQSPDTSHANRWAEALGTAYDAGIVWTWSDLRKLARLFSEIIWDGSTTAPRFTNFTDGDNGSFRTRNAWENGQIYLGWDWMGRYDAGALRAAEAMMDCIIAGSVCVSPSKPYNDTLYGRIALPGNLSKVHAGK